MQDYDYALLVYLYKLCYDRINKLKSNLQRWEHWTNSETPIEKFVTDSAKAKNEIYQLEHFLTLLSIEIGNRLLPDIVDILI